MITHLITTLHIISHPIDKEDSQHGRGTLKDHGIISTMEIMQNVLHVQISAFFSMNKNFHSFFFYQFLKVF